MALLVAHPLLANLSLKRKVRSDDDQLDECDAPPPKILKNYDSPVAIDQITKIHEAIQSIGKPNFAEPALFLQLPFPSPIPLPYDRFLGHGGAVDKFNYVGREMFARLLHFVRRPEIQHGNNALYLYGPSGTGKSHLLATLVCQLVIDN